jgi:uncharacterized protein
VSGLTLHLLPFELAVCRLHSEDTLPSWGLASPFFSLTRTQEELSIVCSQDSVPPGVVCERGWRALMVQGPLDFDLTGILASLLNPLADAGISVFALSTYDTDYVLVKDANLQDALHALSCAGHHIVEPDP